MRDYHRPGLHSLAGRYPKDVFRTAYGRLGEGATWVVEDAALDPGFDEAERRYYLDNGVTAWIDVPLTKGGVLEAVLCLVQDAPRRWTAADVALVEEVAGRCRAELDRAHAAVTLRESEQQQRLMNELVPALLWWADPSGARITGNERWTAYTGQGDAGVQALGWLDAIHADDLEATRAAFAHAFATGTALERYQRIRHVDEGYRWHLVRHVPVRDEAGTITRWFGAAIDVHELHEMQARQQLLVAELQHRVRNILTVTRLTFSRTFEQGGDLDEIASHFRGRLDAMARTQVMLSRDASRTANLEDMIRDELLSVGAREGAGVTIAGPDVTIDHKVAEALGMALHELTTNALKYGALKVPGATLDISWSTNMGKGEGRVLDLVWQEGGVPAVPVGPVHSGFGLELIEEALPYRLRATTGLEFRGGGLRCSITLPLDPAALDPATGAMP